MFHHRILVTGENMFLSKTEHSYCTFVQNVLCIKFEKLHEKVKNDYIF